jgi:hypothetical protein
MLFIKLIKLLVSCIIFKFAFSFFYLDYFFDIFLNECTSISILFENNEELSQNFVKKLNIGEESVIPEPERLVEQNEDSTVFEIVLAHTCVFLFFLVISKIIF